MPQILYFSTKFHRPAGGVRTIFRHVAALRDMGWDAKVVSFGETEDRPTWFEADVPILGIKNGLKISSDDVVVLPEVHETGLKAVQGTRARKVLFCQNQFGLFHGLGQTVSGWSEAGVEYALYCSETVQRAVERCFSFKHSAVIRCVVPSSVFVPRPKTPSVVMMPRKRPHPDHETIRAAFERIWPQYARIPWYRLRGVPEDVVAARLGTATVFLSLSYREGLGLPPLEAMRCGALVAGFTGLGGDEYATPDNGFWVGEEDLFAAADAVGQALHVAQTFPTRADAMRRAGFRTAAYYNEEGMRDDLRRFWTQMVGAPRPQGDSFAGVAVPHQTPAEVPVQAPLRGAEPVAAVPVCAAPAGTGPLSGHARPLRILVTVPHFFGTTPQGLFGSTKGDPMPRLRSLGAQLAGLREGMGDDQGWMNIAVRTLSLANRCFRAKVDVVIHTVKDQHVLNRIRSPFPLFEHRVVEGDPKMLGFACHQTLAERLDDYDLFAFFEDDLVIHDPLFFAKILWFQSIAGPDAVLLPNRYESWMGAPPRRIYVDGEILPRFFQNVAPPLKGPRVEAEVLGQRMAFDAPANPHSGCFILTQAQMRRWREAPYFLDRDVSFVGPLESAATFGIMKTFQIYKPALDNAAFLEVQHAAMRFRSYVTREFRWAEDAPRAGQVVEPQQAAAASAAELAGGGKAANGAGREAPGPASTKGEGGSS